MIKTIVGKRGKGKTQLAKNLIDGSDYDQVFILDYLAEYDYPREGKVFVWRRDLYTFGKIVLKYSNKSKRTLCVFDEVDLYGKNNPHIAYLYKYGRHKNIDLIAVSRRFYDLPVIVRALTEEFLLFQITEERDLNYLRRFVDDNYIKTLIKLEFKQYIKLNFSD